MLGATDQEDDVFFFRDLRHVDQVLLDEVLWRMSCTQVVVTRSVWSPRLSRLSLRSQVRVLRKDGAGDV